MELTKNQLVLFTDVDGTEIKADYLWASYSEKLQSFYIFSETRDEDYQPIRLLSNTIIEKKKRNYKKQTDISKMVEIFPEYTTEKAYAIYTGSNGAVCRGNRKDFYKFIAKSICVIEDDKIYAPKWM